MIFLAFLYIKINKNKILISFKCFFMAKTCIYRVRRKAQVKLRAKQRVKQKHLYLEIAFY
jgi:hypothetical protein